MLTLEQLAALHEEHRADLKAKVREFSLGTREFRFNSERAVMGVINLSRDSWYRESVCLSPEAAIRRAQVLAAQGADLVDIGAESTLAHAERADELLQKSKLVPVVKEVARCGILVSVETYQAEVARVCLEAGAKVINLTGTGRGTDIYPRVAEHEAAVIICYVQGRNVREVERLEFGSEPIEEMREYFAREVELASACGVEKILLDPGVGFYYRNLEDSAVRIRYQMQLFLNTFRLRTLGFPICHALPHAFECFQAEVRAAEGFFAVLAALGKTDLFRTHEVPRVKAVLETLAVYDSMLVH